MTMSRKRYIASFTTLAYTSQTRRCSIKIKHAILRISILIGCCVMLFKLYCHVTLRTRKLRTHYDVDEWFSETEACGGNFIGFGHQFVWLKDTSVDVKSKQFVIECASGIPSYWFYQLPEGTPYDQWLAEMRTIDNKNFRYGSSFRSGITLVVNRFEAHNLYHTMCEVYNIFVMAKQFNWNPKKLEILFTDSRPTSPLDEVWRTFFGSVRRLSDLSQNETNFRNLVWIPIGYESPLNFHQVITVPYIDDFRTFVLNSYDVTPQKSDCKNLTIVLILRHDYVTHPERLTQYGGKVHRKIANEAEVITAVRTAFPTHTVIPILLEKMSFKEQLQLISTTDVLIGMHGAGLSHTMFLPSSASVLELFPPSFEKLYHHFSAMARWRHVQHYAWRNPDQADEIDEGYSSRIPPDYIAKAMSEIKAHINTNYCPDSFY